MAQNKKIYSLTVLEAGHLRCQQNCSSSGLQGEILPCLSLPGSWWLLVGVSGPWHSLAYDCSLCFCLRIAVIFLCLSQHGPS